MVVDAGWRLFMTNEAHRRLAERILADAPGEGDGDGECGTNLMIELFRPGGFRERLANWPEGDVELRLVSLITTFGAPQDVAAQELRLEAFLPADDATDRALRTLADEECLPER